MSAADTLYLKLDKNIRITGKEKSCPGSLDAGTGKKADTEKKSCRVTSVRLGEIAQICCSEKSVENKVKTLRLPTEQINGPGCYVYSILDVLPVIWQEYPKLQITNLGETDFILTLEQPRAGSGAAGRTWNEFRSRVKTILLCLLSFFGAAFSIMAFNTDVGLTELFLRLYEMFTGTVSDGFTVLEISYSIGVGLGILIFFHHFARKKNQTDPTPLQVQMRVYENDVNTTVIETGERSK